MAEAQQEAFDPKSWSETMAADEHVHTYGNFIELMRIGILATLSVIFVLMIFTFGEGGFFIGAAVSLFGFTLLTALVGILSAKTGWGPIAFVTGVAFVIWLFAVL